MLRPDGTVLGPKLGKDVQAVFTAARSGDWQADGDGRVTAAGHALEPGEFELTLQPADDVTAGDTATMTVTRTGTVSTTQALEVTLTLVKLDPSTTYRRDASIYYSRIGDIWRGRGQASAATLPFLTTLIERSGRRTSPR